jgi:hypothetical protein
MTNSKLASYFSFGANNNIKRHCVFSNRRPNVRFMGLVSLGVLIGLFLVLELWKNYKYSIWNKREQITFTFEQNNNIGYVRIDKNLSNVAIYMFPSNTHVSLANGYGEYRADKIKELAKMEKIKFGNILMKSMTRYLGVITDGYIVEVKGSDVNIVNLIRGALFSKSQSNFSKWDLFNMYAFVASLRSDEIEVSDLTKNRALSVQKLSDGQDVYIPNGESFDLFALTELAKPQFLREEYNWEIFNGTNHEGFGEMMRKIVANSGFNVSGVRQAKEAYDKSFISLKDDIKTSESIKYFATYFDLPIKHVSSLHDRADVVLVLGEDFWKQCCQMQK